MFSNKHWNFIAVVKVMWLVEFLSTKLWVKAWKALNAEQTAWLHPFLIDTNNLLVNCQRQAKLYCTAYYSTSNVTWNCIFSLNYSIIFFFLSFTLLWQIYTKILCKKANWEAPHIFPDNVFALYNVNNLSSSKVDIGPTLPTTSFLDFGQPFCLIWLYSQTNFSSFTLESLTLKGNKCVCLQKEKEQVYRHIFMAHKKMDFSK